MAELDPNPGPNYTYEPRLMSADDVRSLAAYWTVNAPCDGVEARARRAIRTLSDSHERLRAQYDRVRARIVVPAGTNTTLCQLCGNWWRADGEPRHFSSRDGTPCPAAEL